MTAGKNKESKKRGRLCREKKRKTRISAIRDEKKKRWGLLENKAYKATGGGEKRDNV